MDSYSPSPCLLCPESNPCIHRHQGLTSRVLNAEGAENGLDVGVSLLTFGLLPQRVLLHGEAGDPDPGMRPRPHPQDLRRLSFSSQDTTVPSPCFDFGEKKPNKMQHLEFSGVFKSITKCCTSTERVDPSEHQQLLLNNPMHYRIDSSQTHDSLADRSFTHVVN
ncbi:unnamed protein product [Boreogadus saida]